MNLVIDDAVEVSQITKTNEKETRKSLGGPITRFIFPRKMCFRLTFVVNRSNLTER